MPLPYPVARYIGLAGLALVCSACATQRPVMYPNPHYQSVGQATVDADIDACIAMANNAGVSNDKSAEIATDAAGSAAVGAAAGAAAGAVYGNLGRGTAAGAAAAGAGSLTRGVIQSGKPDALYKAFVERCLREKGYDPIGWR